MADRDPVEVEADALAKAFRKTFILNISLATAGGLSADGADALREAADAAEAEVARLIRTSANRALPLSNAPASPWPKVAKQMADALEAAYEDANDQKVADLIDTALVAYKRIPTPPAKDEWA